MGFLVSEKTILVSFPVLHILKSFFYLKNQKKIKPAKRGDKDKELTTPTSKNRPTTSVQSTPKSLLQARTPRNLGKTSIQEPEDEQEQPPVTDDEQEATEVDAVFEGKSLFVFYSYLSDV